MDKVLYTAMTGARRSMQAQQLRANNLANVNTVGFRSDFERAASYELGGDGYKTRILSQPEGLGSSFATGSMNFTGRELDAAIQGDGFFAVQDANGNEVYARGGNFNIDADGNLFSAAGYTVLDNGGAPVQIPKYRELSIREDGMITVIPEEGGGTVEVTQLKLVNPEINTLSKQEDGHFVVAGGGEAPVDPDVKVSGGFLETSNVNPVEQMVALLTVNRQFELQVKMMKAAESMSQSSVRLLRA